MLFPRFSELNMCLNNELQLMDETFNQLAGGGVPVVGLVQTLAEFATSYGKHISVFSLSNSNDSRIDIDDEIGKTQKGPRLMRRRCYSRRKLELRCLVSYFALCATPLSLEIWIDHGRFAVCPSV